MFGWERHSQKIATVTKQLFPNEVSAAEKRNPPNKYIYMYNRTSHAEAHDYLINVHVHVEESRKPQISTLLVV